MRGSQGLKPADAARNAPPLQHGALRGWQGLSDGKADEKQLLNFPNRDVFRPAPQPAVGAGQAGSQRYPTLAANDAARPRRRNLYNWDGRYISQAASEQERAPRVRRVLFPVGALALLAGVAFGAFYLMQTFADSPATAVAAVPAKAETAAPAKAGTTTAVARIPEASATAKASAAGGDTAARPSVSGAPVKTAALPVNPAAPAAKVPAPGNARWGKAEGAMTAAAAVPAEAEAAPKVDTPPSAPVPSEEPKMAASKASDPKAEAPKKLAYAAPEKAVRPVDKTATAALPPASGKTALPGVDTDPLSVAPAKADASDDGNVSGGYASTVHTDVKLHAGPSNGSRSLGVVPRKATVQVLSCSGWCKVSYGGKQGYIYKSFLGHAAASAAAQKPAPEKTAAAAPQAEASQPGAPAPADAKALEEAAKRTVMRAR